jgi:hypothetical protein
MTDQRRRVALVIAFGVVSTVLGLSSAAATTENGEVPATVSAEIAPEQVTIRPGDTTEVTLLLHNAGPVTAQILSFEVRAPAQLRVGPLPDVSAIRPLGPGGSRLRHFSVSALEGLETATVALIVRSRDSHDPTARVGVTTATLTVTAGEALSKIDTSLTGLAAAIHDGQTVSGIARITNSTAAALSLVSVTGLDSDSLKVTLKPQGKAPASLPCDRLGLPAPASSICVGPLAQGETLIVSVSVAADSRVRTGTQAVGLLIEADRTTDKAPVVSTVLEKSFDVSVFGLDSLSAFGVTTLFVVPGLVAIVLFLVLAKYAYPRTKSVPDLPDFADPAAMVIVVPLSILAYGAVWLFFQHNLTLEIGTKDVLLLFGVGAGVGAMGWLGTALFFFCRTGRKRFKKSDSPRKVLQKLGRRDAGLTFPQVTFRGSSYRYLAESADGEAAFCPVISYTFDEAPTAVRQEWQRAVQAKKPSDLAKIAKDGQPKLHWMTAGGLTLLSAEKAGPLAAEQPLLVDAPLDGA